MTTTITVEFTAFDMDYEVGTFDVAIAANSTAQTLLGSTIAAGGVAMKITAVRRWDAASLELEADVEYA